MPSVGDVTRWLQQLKAGDRDAAQPLWERYFPRVVALARDRLRALARAAADEEDVALSALDSFCRNAERGRFPRLDDRDDLWHLLLAIVIRKACDLVRHETREKRDWRRRVPLDAEAGDPPARDLTPALAAELAEETGRLLGLLPNDRMRVVAVRKLEGSTNQEIAGLLAGCSLATVERCLKAIRKHWEKELPS
jgi:DNA-directed RNA polymerase specialized sigma24 family protein